MVFDGGPFLPSGVLRSDTGRVLTGAQARTAAVEHPDRYVPDPVRRISAEAVPCGAVALPGVDLVAAVLRRVLDETERMCGGALAEVVLVVPPGWGPQRRQCLLEAANHAGVRRPVLVPAAVAVAGAADGVDLSVGQWVAVCDLGARAAVSVVRRTGSGIEALAEMDSDAGGDRIDHALAVHVTTNAAAHHTTRPAGVPAGRETAGETAGETVRAGVAAASGAASGAVLEPVSQAVSQAVCDVAEISDASDPSAVSEAMLVAVRAAKEAAAAGQAVVVPGPHGRPSVVLTGADVTDVAGTVLDVVACLVSQAVEAAEVPPATGAGLLLVGGTAAIPGAADRLAAGTGLPTRVLPDPQRATVLAAARATDPNRPVAAGRDSRRGPRAADPASLRRTVSTGRSDDVSMPAGSVAPRMRDLIGPLVPALASLGLFILALGTGEGPDDPPPGFPLLLEDGLLALAAVFVVVAAVSFGVASGPDLLVNPARVPPSRRARMARTAAAAGAAAGACAGVAVAGLYAIAAAGYFGGWHLRLLAWTLLPAIVVAAVATACAAMIYRGAPPPRNGWVRLLSLPHRCVILATAGTVIMIWAQNIYYLQPLYLRWKIDLMLDVGAIVLGIATACAVADRILIQILAATVLIPTFGLSASRDSLNTVICLFAAAVAWWWLRRALQIGTGHIRGPIRPPAWTRPP
ncbi:hypothetical protein Vau01_123630 [Virgisporangium aurantiacum]|uniref:Hsp70 protein n=1 Tax=Virgisporangium aurantiacum TaxID=175570 RepID=A0A8J3ZIQ6_9ACTN|nr:hypothetical protein Vau01_123630 [Virgisporangium aurantiacum]